ncbi:MAG: CAP domain-containing protein [Acidobacteria bacterium]|nr:CAP domain-containing protein [Acidobacteriota bacterium]
MNPRTRILVLATLSLITSLLFVGFPVAGGRASGNGGTDAETADYLTAPEKALVREINLLRSNPQGYIQYLEQAKKYYKGKDYIMPGQPVLTTVEGVSAVDEAIAFLRSAKALSSYSLSKGMCLAAKDHVKDLGGTGSTGHKGTDGSTTEMRVNRYGNFSNGIGENIFYENESPREVVVSWLIDDGVASRGHRRNLLSNSYRVLGVSVGERNSYGSMCVLTFAGNYAEGAGKAQPAGAPVNGKAAARKL